MRDATVGMCSAGGRQWGWCGGSEVPACGFQMEQCVKGMSPSPAKEGRLKPYDNITIIFATESWYGEPNRCLRSMRGRRWNQGFARLAGERLASPAQRGYSSGAVRCGACALCVRGQFRW